MGTLKKIPNILADQIALKETANEKIISGCKIFFGLGILLLHVFIKTTSDIQINIPLEVLLIDFSVLIYGLFLF